MTIKELKKMVEKAHAKSLRYSQDLQGDNPPTKLMREHSVAQAEAYQNVLEAIGNHTTMLRLAGQDPFISD